MKVEVVKYRPEWAEEFEREAEKIKEILGENLLAIHHIGSTAVAGLAAKPIIDIMPVVKDVRKAEEQNAAFEALGYECMGEFGIAGRRYFRKGKEKRTHHLHLFEEANEADVSRHLAVRDYLRRHKDKADEYGALKESLAARFPADLESYCNGKDEFVKAMEKEAVKEFRALAYFSRDKNLYVDMWECVQKGTSQILRAAENGVLLYEKSSGIHMFAAEEKESACAVLKALDEKKWKERSGLLVAHGETAREAAYETLHLKGETACYQVSYTEKSVVERKCGLEFRLPLREEIEIIKREYHLESPENIEKLCAAGKIFCAFLKQDRGEAFVGFIGRHPEGSMGLLLVFPEYRRRGYGAELESFMIEKILGEGRIPYAHIIEDNFNSLSLQRKLGCEAAEEKVYWLFAN